MPHQKGSPPSAEKGSPPSAEKMADTKQPRSQTSHDVEQSKDVEKAKIAIKIPTDAWMIRPCGIYRQEYSDCMSIWNRSNQLHVHNVALNVKRDCQPWNDDYKACMKFKRTMNPQCLLSIIEHEKERRQKRLATMRANDVWEYYENPAEHWERDTHEEYPPHPEFLEYEQMKQDGVPIKTPRTCTFM